MCMKDKKELYLNSPDRILLTVLLGIIFKAAVTDDGVKWDESMSEGESEDFVESMETVNVDMAELNRKLNHYLLNRMKYRLWTWMR